VRSAGSACPGSVSSLRERLRALLLFSDLDDEQLDALAAGAREFSVAAGQPLIQRGDPGSGLFVLEEGRAVVDAPEGSRQLGPGDVFGERSLLDDVERTARVRAETDVRCLAIPRPDLERVLAARPDVGERLRHLS
jgi:CRP/FNR family transcriptional regulator, cyclic AMP receptor protein